MSENKIIETIEKDAEAVGEEVVKVLEWIGQEIFTIGKAVFTAEEQLIMTKLGGLLQADAITIQNDQPGVDQETLWNQLKGNSTAALAGLGAQLGFVAVATTIGVVVKQVGALASQGNAGNAPAGNLSPVSGT